MGKTRSGEAYSGLHASSLKRPYRCAHIVPAVERTHSGSRWVKEIFPESIQRLGKAIANASREMAYPKIIDEAFNEYAF